MQKKKITNLIYINTQGMPEIQQQRTVIENKTE